MTQEEWTQGIHNEAHTVQDEQWTAEAMRHLKIRRQQQAALYAVGAVTLGSAFGAVTILLTQFPVLTREATRNGLDLLTFLRWNAFGHPHAVHTITYSTDPVFPVAALLLLLFMVSAVATRTGLPRWVILLTAGAATLTMASMTSLVVPVFRGVPVTPMLLALGTTALGIVLGLGFRSGPPDRTAR